MPLVKLLFEGVTLFNLGRHRRTVNEGSTSRLMLLVCAPDVDWADEAGWAPDDAHSNAVTWVGVWKTRWRDASAWTGISAPIRSGDCIGCRRQLDGCAMLRTRSACFGLTPAFSGCAAKLRSVSAHWMPAQRRTAEAEDRYAPNRALSISQSHFILSHRNASAPLFRLWF